jgi:DNA-binding NarL/FixJ family response regulator
MPARPSASAVDLVATVVVVASEEYFRRRVRIRLSTLEGVGVAGEATDGNAAAIICAIARPDVVVMDAGLPEHEASEVMRRINRASPETRVVVCPASVSASQITEMLAAAAGLDDLDGVSAGGPKPSRP